MKLTLVRPTLEMKEMALDYKKEHFAHNEMIINGSEFRMSVLQSAWGRISLGYIK